MKLPGNVRRKPVWLELLPWVGRGTSTAIYPNVWLSSGLYDRLKAESADPYDLSQVIHEQEHIKRAKNYGVAKWYLRYILDRRFRFEEELAANKPQLKYLKDQGLTFNLGRRAKSLSSWLYLWTASNATATAELRRLWDEV